MTPRNIENYHRVQPGEFAARCAGIFHAGGKLRMMFAADERETDGRMNIYAVFSSIADHGSFDIITTAVEDEGGFRYQSITPRVPAAHWYEREMACMFGIVPEGHPDLRPLVLHGMYPEGVFPLRRDITAADVRSKVDLAKDDAYPYKTVEGEGVFEIPVGPVHAGIIEPGHFRFSAVGESIYFLDPRLFYTHKGVEKLFEQVGFERGIQIAERISGTSSFCHSTAYCLAVENMRGVEIPIRAKAVRTFLVELERLYNHIGDIGNLCAGTGFAAGYAGGAELKERLMALNHRLTGSRYLRGVNRLGGVSRDVLEDVESISAELSVVTDEFKAVMKFIMSSISHMERLEGPGFLSREAAVKLGATGIAARASGVNDDLRTAHPNLFYDRIIFEVHTRNRGDVLARMMLRADEAACSLAMLRSILRKAKPQKKELMAADAQQDARPADIGGGRQALGWVEGARGSIFYFVKAAADGKSPLRVKVRSASFCNWPLLPLAVLNDIVPDFPLINKSFNLSYSGCDM
ncbi:MAG: NADH-quinone oxidoreductase subunit C [Actinomycetota bacterium]|nr:NADH-quinone oxidoreductase subunit C [Actinomycetota bacterium]